MNNNYDSEIYFIGLIPPGWVVPRKFFGEYLKTNSGEENKLLGRLWRNLVETSENLETPPVFSTPGY